MFNNLDASNFSGSIPFYDINFEDILSKITVCYKMMISDKVSLENHENKIRTFLLKNYLRNNAIRESVGFVDSEIHFEKEIDEDHSIGRTDLKVISRNTFIKQEAYYIIECKVLKDKNTEGQKGLNAKYIYNGIYRFTSNYYSSFYRENAMIGFIVEKLDIHKNIENINLLLQSNKTINTTREITKSSFIENFEYHYDSEHLDSDNQKLKIYHLMFDFNKNIN